MGTAASGICSGSECAKVCNTAYLACGYSDTGECKSGCGSQACRNYSDIVRSSLCYCDCPINIGTTWAASCTACTSTYIEDFPQCTINNATAWGSCSSSVTQSITIGSENGGNSPATSAPTQVSRGTKSFSVYHLSLTVMNVLKLLYFSYI